MKIRALFERAEKTSPTLLFLDELDALAPNRGDRYTGHHYKAEVNEFLVQLNNCWNRKILVIAATNLLENIDPAILLFLKITKELRRNPRYFSSGKK